MRSLPGRMPWPKRSPAGPAASCTAASVPARHRSAARVCRTAGALDAASGPHAAAVEPGTLAALCDGWTGAAGRRWCRALGIGGADSAAINKRASPASATPGSWQHPAHGSRRSTTACRACCLPPDPNSRPTVEPPRDPVADNSAARRSPPRQSQQPRSWQLPRRWANKRPPPNR